MYFFVFFDIAHSPAQFSSLRFSFLLIMCNVNISENRIEHQKLRKTGFKYIA